MIILNYIAQSLFLLSVSEVFPTLFRPSSPEAKGLTTPSWSREPWLEP